MKLFVKNIGVTALSVLTPLFFFKLITFYLNFSVLSEYFQIKALAMIAYYLTSLRFSEIIYIFRGKNQFSIKSLINLQYSFSLLVSIIAILILSIVYNWFFFGFTFVAAYFIFQSNEIIESKLNIYRLFNIYNRMYLIKGFQLFKPLLFFLFIKYFSLFQIKDTVDVFIFEVVFSYCFIGIFVLFRKVRVSRIVVNLKLLIINIKAIKNSWLLSVSKMPYEALPNYLLSYYTSDHLYVQYNVARKIYGVIIVGKTSLIQVFNTLSIDYKNDFMIYLKRFYKIMIPIEIFILGVVYFLSSIIFKTISNVEYATDVSKRILLIMLFISSGFILLYPFRQWIILNNLIVYNNKAIINSIIIFTLLSFIFIPIVSVYAASVIQPLGQLLPIIITYFILPEKYKALLIKQITAYV